MFDSEAIRKAVEFHLAILDLKTDLTDNRFILKADTYANKVEQLVTYQNRLETHVINMTDQERDIFISIISKDINE